MNTNIFVIFDMDGVLLDTEQVVIDAWKKTGPRFGVIDLDELETVARACIGSNMDSTKEIFCSHYQDRIPGFDYDTYRKETDDAVREMMKVPPVKRGAAEILSELKRRGIPMAIASSTREATVRRELGAVGLLDYFEKIVGGDMIKRSKPAPDIYLAAAEALGASPEDCLVIEDSYHGVRSASAAGMTVFMVPDLLAPIPEITALCEGIFPDLVELKEAFAARFDETEGVPKTTLCYVTDGDQTLMLHRVKKKDDVNQEKWIGIGGHLEEGETPDECLLREAKEEAGFTPENPVMRGIITFRLETENRAEKLIEKRNESDSGLTSEEKARSDSKVLYEEKTRSDSKVLYEEKTRSDSKVHYEEKTECDTKITSDEFREIMYLYTADGLSSEEPLPVCDEGNLVWVKNDEIGSLNLWEGDRVFLQLLADEKPFFRMDLTYRADGVLKKVILDGKELELFDVLTPEGVPSGIVRERGVVHRTGTYHHTVHMWIARKTERGIEILLQKRSKNKDSNPGCFDISSAGHMSAGDEALPAACRELSEELGITLPPSAIHWIGNREKTVRKVFYGKPFIDHELSEVYLITEPIDISDLTLQTEELESVSWMLLSECMEKLSDPSFPNCIDPEELHMIADSDCIF